jgi:hypothetical protein
MTASGASGWRAIGEVGERIGTSGSLVAVQACLHSVLHNTGTATHANLRPEFYESKNTKVPTHSCVLGLVLHPFSCFLHLVRRWSLTTTFFIAAGVS